MIVMNLKLDNFLLFNDFEINMSYPKKIVGSSIDAEYLSTRPNFRYKKLVILMGANATGKTALGRVLMGICNFIKRKEYNTLVNLIEDVTKTAGFEMDFIAEENVLYRITATISPSKDISYYSDNIRVCVKKVNILMKDNYERCAARLDELNCESSSNYIVELEKIPSLSWMFEYPFASEGKQQIVRPANLDMYQKYLEVVLKSLDPRIDAVKQVEGAEGTYLIMRDSGAIIIENGELKSPEKLSSGTQEGIGLANILVNMKLHACNFYYCDEKFSHIHSEVERAFLSLFVNLLDSDEQLFFTTHNLDVLDMEFPLHSFAFMRRDEFGNYPPSCVFASEYIKKNNVSLRAAVENDIFSASPDVSEIFRINEM